jgi:hypothetical protein
MPKIINAFRGTSPVANSISQLGLALFGDNLSSDLKRAQLEALQRQNTETSLLGQDVANMGGAAAVASDPVVQGRVISSGYKPQEFSDLARMDAAVRGDPRVSDYMLGSGQAESSTPRGFGADQSRQERQHGASLGETTRHNMADETLNRDKFGFDKTKFYEEPQAALVNGQPQYVPRGRLTDTGTAPILSDTDRKGTLIDNQFQYLTPEEQKQYLGANPTVGTTRNLVTPSGTFQITDESLSRGLDARGRPLPEPSDKDYIGSVEGSAADVGLTNAVTTDAQSDILGGNAFIAQADAMIKLATENPASFGMIGAARNAGQELNQGWRVLAQHLGFSPDLLAQQAKAKGFDISAYDRSLPQVQMLGTALTYSAASAIAGQENRSVSDTDREIWQEAMGHAQSFFSLDTAQSIAERAKFAKAIVLEHQRLARGALEQGYKFDPNGSNSLLGQAVSNVLANPNSFTAGPTQNVPGFSVSPTAAPADPNAPAQAPAGGVEVWQRGPDGVPRRVQ